MLKQSLIYLILTVIIVLLAHYFQLFIFSINRIYLYSQTTLLHWFNPNNTGNLIIKLLLLVGIPILIAAIPALIYRLIKGKNMPHFLVLTWGIWLILMLNYLLIH